ncbi:hypothetical protein NDU88_004882 [Pleurodeles waltl]|uniref:Uncharacterized protein n=1 Tax=Pleurodeles waltl TaxID=8319 RepID=A0AAV7V2C7_PLEWA|nr:hypothetical protein NDU88_004882 [Pleurodeles waltl]
MGTVWGSCRVIRDVFPLFPGENDPLAPTRCTLFVKPPLLAVMGLSNEDASPKTNNTEAVCEGSLVAVASSGWLTTRPSDRKFATNCPCVKCGVMQPYLKARPLL